jgi:hypothetical protein
MADYVSGTITSGLGNQPMYIVVEFPAKLLNFGKQLEKKLPGFLHRIGMEGKSFWKSEAGRKLTSSRNAYVKAITFKRIDNLSFCLMLDGDLAKATETGWDPFDMKPGLMRSSKVQTMPMKNKFGKPRKFPRAIAAGFPAKSTATKYMIIPLNSKGDKDRNGDFAKGKPNIAMTKPKVFRTITDKTPEHKWKHPGYKGIHLMESVVEEILTNIVPKHVKLLIKDVLDGNSP